VGLRDRLKKLEAATGGSDGCERCRATLIIRIGSGATSVTKDSRRWLEGAEAAAYDSQEQPSGRCPVCGTVRKSVVKIGSYKAS
jgi:ribosomal protein L37AE/L43A